MDPRTDALVQTYPFLDHLMAETLLKMSDEGKLESYIKNSTPTSSTPTSKVIVGAITVEDQENFSPPLTETT